MIAFFVNAEVKFYFLLQKVGRPVCPEHELRTSRLYHKAGWNQGEYESDLDWLVDRGTNLFVC